MTSNCGTKHLCKESGEEAKQQSHDCEAKALWFFRSMSLALDWGEGTGQAVQVKFESLAATGILALVYLVLKI